MYQGGPRTPCLFAARARLRRLRLRRVVGPWGLSRYRAGPHPTAAHLFVCGSRASALLSRRSVCGPTSHAGPPLGGFAGVARFPIVPVLPRCLFCPFLPVCARVSWLVFLRRGAGALDTLETSATTGGAPWVCGGLLPPPPSLGEPPPAPPPVRRWTARG